MTDVEWQAAIAAAPAPPPPPTVTAHTFLHAWGSFSRPVALSCDDGNDYVVKAKTGIERALFAEQLVSQLATYVGAPVPSTALVDVPDQLVAAESQLQGLFVGRRLGHGSRRMPNCGDRLELQHSNEPDNRPRFAALFVLYSWAGCFGDHQVIYENTAPHLVYSVDHGHFLPGGPNWDINSLQRAPAAVPDPWFGPCNLLNVETRTPCEALRAVTEANIATAVKIPPDSWAVPVQDRVALAEYLLQRKNTLDALWAGV